MRRKLALIVLLCFSLSILLVGCAKEEPAVAPGPDTSWEDIQAKGYFVLGLDDAFPPMGYREEGTNDIVGFDIDLAKAVAERMGVEVKLQPCIWDTIIEELNGEKIDVIWNGLTITEERKQRINFTSPYMNNRQIIVVQTNSDITTKPDLEGKEIGIQAGSSAIKAVKADAETFAIIGKLTEFASNDEALLDLSFGRVDAVVVDEIVGRFYIAKKPGVYTILEDNFGEEEFGIGVRKADVSFLNKLNETLDEMKADGSAAAISQKWFGENVLK